MTIYVDLLLCYNLLIHFCLFSSTAALAGVKVRLWRMLAGSVLGSLGSFLIFLRPGVWLLLGIKAALAVLLTFVTFGFHSLQSFRRMLLLFLAVNFIYAGGMTAVNAAAPPGFVYQNGVAYFAAQTGEYLAGILLSYLLLRAGVWFMTRNRGRQTALLYLKVGERSVICSGFCDSGNRVCDLYTGKPVVILSPQIAQKLLPDGIPTSAGEFSAFGHHIRLIPLDTVSGSTLMPVFAPDEMTINGRAYDFFAGISKTALADGMEALLPAAALR